MKKYCTKCGKPFDAVGREVICPSCKQAAAEDTKRAAVLRAKQASWTGESVPVRISGRASTIIRGYGKAHDLPFARALDALLQASDYVKSLDTAWADVTPYKSQRRDKHTTDVKQDVKQEVKQEVKTPQANKPVNASTASKASTAKAKAADSKAASKASKASKPISTK